MTVLTEHVNPKTNYGMLGIMASCWKNLNIILTLGLLFNTCTPVMGYELDMSVDDEIRKKYNTEKLEHDVLNNTLNNNIKNNSGHNNVYKTTPNLQLDYSAALPEITKADKKFYRKIPKWTTFSVKSDQTISNYTPKGTKITFTSNQPVYKKNITIPSGTKFYGEIVNSHPPQRTGNGGLVVIKINAISYNGQVYPFEGKITKATAKKVFFNKIKGKRQYIAGVGKHIDKGESFYKKSKKLSSKMADNPILIILSPVPAVIGIAGYAGATVLSPLTALTVKGGNLSLPAGSSFEIRLLDEAYVN